MPKRVGSALSWGVLLALWASVTETGFVDPLFLSSPTDTFAAMFDGVTTGELLRAAMATLARAYGGFLIATLLGVPLGLMLGGMPRINAAIGGVVDAFRSMPATALFPAFLLLFGIGDTAKVAVATFVCTWAIAIYTAYGVRVAGETRRFLLRLHGTTRTQRFLDGLLRPALPNIVGGMRSALSLALVVTIGIEMIVGTTVGLGRTIYIAQLTYRIPRMYAAIMMAALLGIASNAVFAVGTRRIIHWDRVI